MGNNWSMESQKRRTNSSFGTALWVLLAAAIPIVARAQLTDVAQTTPGVPGGAINRTLEQQIGSGRGDDATEGSSLYLIARDPVRAIRRGRQVFQRKFTARQGLGPRVTASSAGNIRENAAYGAGLTDSCAACHGRPRGSAGVGGNVATRPDSRDAPHLFGAGLVERLADEITGELRSIRTKATQQARQSGAPVTLPLVGKGIQYGSIQGLPDGRVVTTGVEGVDPDLRVRPFFAHGGEYSLRAFAVGAFKDEMGLESPDPVLCQATNPAGSIRTASPAGMVFDRALDSVKRPPSCDATHDGDGDGVANEIDPALLDYLEFYLLNYFRPAVAETTSRTNAGLALMRRIGCTNCHVQNLTIERDARVVDVDTRFDPRRGILNRLFATATLFVTTVGDNQPFPKMLPSGGRFTVENIFTDFKRHDLGPAFHERQYDGTIATAFMTEPLWGVASTTPYGHDGRSISIEEATLRHDGEARASKQAFAALSEDDRRKVLELLGTLVLFPPDDTASNLNPGRPNATNSHTPSEFGSIDLGTLFKTPGGPE